MSAAVAVPLLTVLQYRWLSDLGAAQRRERQQTWADAVVRSAAAVNGDLSTFYAAVLESGQAQPGAAALEAAIAAWRERSTTLGAVARAYLHRRDDRRWVAATGAPGSIDGRAFDGVGDSVSDVPFAASWLAPTRTLSLPSLVISLPSSGPVDAVMLTFESGACHDVLRVLHERDIESRSEMRLAIVVEGAPANESACADSGFDLRDRDQIRTPVFRLQPAATGFPRAAAGEHGAGIVMTSGIRSPTWQLAAEPAGDDVSLVVDRVQTRNLWLAAGLELTLVASIVALTIATRHARRTADAHRKFSAVVAHELRTPLAAIKVLAQNQSRGLVRREEHIVEYGNTLAAEADRLHAFVENVLQFTAGGPSSARRRTQRVDFERVLSAALAPLRMRITGSGVTVRSSIEAAARITLGNESGLVLAVRNLVQNALDHAEGAQTVTIDVRARDRHIVVSVTDDGGGIAEADRTRLFDPFVRGRRARDRAVSGHGLGLAIVRDVARAHGGRAIYQSDNGGSTFIFTVRLHADDVVEN